MNEFSRRLCLIAIVAAAAVPVVASATDWPMWGHDPSRNMASAETGLPTTWDVGQMKAGTEDVDMATTKGIRWVAKLGSQAYGNPVISGGHVYVGTNNESPRDPKYKGDRSVLMCFDEKSGKLVWQLNVPKLGTGKVSDWEYLGICSSPAVEGNRVYVVTNRCEVLCLDTEGMANGNDGPFKDEAKYLGGPGKPPIQPGPTDGDIIWRYDMREELGIFPHNITSCSAEIAGDKLAITTSNGVDWTHTSIPNTKAPALILLDKKTGELVGEEHVGISERILHSNWSSPSYGVVNGKPQVIFGAGDGWCYGFDTNPTKGADGIYILNNIWKYDCDPPSYRFDKAGKPIKYATHDGPSEVIATPVFYKNRVYVPIGQDPEHGEGIGNLSCIDVTKTGDITKTGKIWSYDKIARSLCTPAIADGLLFVGDFSGFVHCLDAETGKPQWVFDTKSHLWGSLMVADGKLHFGTEDGDFYIMQAGRTQKTINKVDMKSPVYSTPVCANGAIYITTPTHLYCVGKP